MGSVEKFFPKIPKIWFCEICLELLILFLGILHEVMKQQSASFGHMPGPFNVKGQIIRSLNIYLGYHDSILLILMES